MSVKITYFIHAESADNQKGIASGWADAKLSESGLKQAQELREQAKGQKFDAVFSSDLLRSVETARMAFGNIAPIFHDRRLRECNYGIFNSKPASFVETVRHKYVERKFPGGESYLDVKTRIEDFLNFLKADYEGKNVVIIASKGPKLVMDVILNNQSWEQVFADKTDNNGKLSAWEYILQ